MDERMLKEFLHDLNTWTSASVSPNSLNDGREFEALARHEGGEESEFHCAS